MRRRNIILLLCLLLPVCLGAQNLSLEHMESRYKAGQVTASALTQASLEVSSAREKLVSARIAYRKAVNAYQSHTVDR